MKIFIVFPHQLFDDFKKFEAIDKIVLIEEYLFFKEFPFHKTKLVYHRASMQNYALEISRKGFEVDYIESINLACDVRNFIANCSAEEIYLWEFHDDWLQQRVEESCRKKNIKTTIFRSTYFLNSAEEIKTYFKGKKRLLQNDFYIDQRKRRKILLDELNQPIGGQWNFDKENRLKYPKHKTPPAINAFDNAEEKAILKEAREYVTTNFANNPGEIDARIPYPISSKGAKAWLLDFIQNRFSEFGPYEDAIVAKESVLHHSLLTPMLNVGLLSPHDIIETVIGQTTNEFPIASLEGFIRQIMGWREFIHGIYLLKGRKERSTNYWGFTRKIPKSFWEGTTGIPPIDQTIKKILETGYCHHIERLMLLGNFMLLCEFDPNEVYHWFMSLFIDAYDWVMVPNVYGMSQFADGGLMATKPYISGSNYVCKMSDYPKGEWTEIWDALFWHFMEKQRRFFSSNPRLSMLLGTLDKMPNEKRKLLMDRANAYFSQLEKE